MGAQANRRTDTNTSASLSGAWLWIARIAWAIIALGAVGYFIYLLPEFYKSASVVIENPTMFTYGPPTPEMIVLFEKIGLSLGVYQGFWLALVILFGLVMIGLGAFIVLQRSDEFVALFVSAFLIVFGTTGLHGDYFISHAVLPQWALYFKQTMGMLTWQFFSVFFYIFPDGKLPKRWLIALLPMSIGLPIVMNQFPGSPLNPVNMPPTPAAISMLLFFGVPFVAVVVRYRSHATPAQRQQLKWVALGGGLVLLTFATVYPALNALSHTLPPVGSGIVRFLMIPLFLLVFSTIPIAITIAILRYGLWNINYVINRSLVYTFLTVVLGAIFAAGFFLIRAILRGIGLDQDLIAVGVPLLGAAVAFNPVRNRLRRFVDRSFYGIQLDYEQAVKDYQEQEKKVFRSADTQSAIGDYADLTLIGRGGMGEVYRGYDPDGQSVAIKILPGEHDADDIALKRFSREAQTIANLDHPNIVRLHTVGAKDNIPYMVMDFIDGGDLSDLLKEQGALSLEQALPLLQGIASALDYAHSQGIVHRDIKPSNVMVESGTNRAVLMDFGIARIANALTQLTGTGGLVGTLDYISPEQIQGSNEVEHHADIYSLGVMTYEMLTGKLPFEKGNPGAMVMAHLMEPAPDIRKALPDLSDSVAHAMMKAMAKKPGERFESAGAMIRAMM